MKNIAIYTIRAIFFLTIAFCFNAKAQIYSVDFYDGAFNFQADTTFNIQFNDSLSNQSIKQFYNRLASSNYQPVLAQLSACQKKYKLNDWLYYQLIRKTVEQISPKKENYARYTLYKWFLMCKSGYDARIAIGNRQIIFYIRNEEDISDIPFFQIEHRKYTCLNYHDYGKLFQKENTYVPVNITVAEAKRAFSYKITEMPEFKPEDYVVKQLTFAYKNKAYHFEIKVNNEVENIFANYPGVDFESYFNIPLSRETYQSLIPTLKQNLKGMNNKKGVDYLMRFTRYTFLYENDEDNFGKEKRLSPEQTLSSKYSDCDDRVALFFYLVKEIYHLPMIAMLYPTHITMAVQFKKPIGNAIYYNGKAYSVCEPTPQKENLKIGTLSASLKNQKYQIVYAYQP
ncbi:hypothetical protein ABIB40_001947 [Pedobacter sp. UYP30]|uniref:hypothetical protein n=1 Tax=Pedobacter sp. UYP30 TaxID=1756400 RepID=UPI0033926129